MAIRDLISSEKVEGNFIIKFKKPVQKYAKGYGFQLNIGDSSGSMMLKYWGPDNEARVAELYNSLGIDDVIFISGKTNLYNDVISINVDSSGEIRKLKEGEYDLSEFVRVSERDIEKMSSTLNGFLNSVKNPELKKLIGSFTKDAEFMEKFRKHPAAIYRHQGWVGGLMEHTLNMMTICESMSTIYPELDRDLMITGCFMHDIGKLEELEVSGSIKATEDGIMVGHLTLGVLMIEKRMEKTGINGNLRRKLLNISISHHGQLEYGSPKLPAFPEALVVAQADMMDSQVCTMVDFKKNAQTEDKFAYNKDMGNIYLE